MKKFIERRVIGCQGTPEGRSSRGKLFQREEARTRDWMTTERGEHQEARFLGRGVGGGKALEGWGSTFSKKMKEASGRLHWGGEVPQRN